MIQLSAIQLRLGLFLSFMSRRGNKLRLLLCVGLFLSYFFFPRVGYVFGDGLLNHCLYMFSHANIWHLLANIVCIWLIRCPFHLVGSLLVAVLCSFLPCFTSELTYGFSGVLFCTVGISWGVAGRFRDMLWKNKWYLLIPFVLPHINGFLHVYCMVVGYLLGCSVYRRKFRTSDLL